jgi:hypothetical protein
MIDSLKPPHYIPLPTFNPALPPLTSTPIFFHTRRPLSHSTCFRLHSTCMSHWANGGSCTRYCAKGSPGQLQRRWLVTTMLRSSRPPQHCHRLLFFRAHLGDVSTLHSALFFAFRTSQTLSFFASPSHIPAVKGFKPEWPTHRLSQSTFPFCSKPSNLPLLDHHPLSWTLTQRQ